MIDRSRQVLRRLQAVAHHCPALAFAMVASHDGMAVALHAEVMGANDGFEVHAVTHRHSDLLCVEKDSSHA